MLVTVKRRVPAYKSLLASHTDSQEIHLFRSNAALELRKELRKGSTNKAGGAAYSS